MKLPLDAHLDDDSVELLRERSKQLYGNRYRVEVAAAIAEAGETFYVRELSKVTGIPDPQIREMLMGMVAAKVVRRIKGKRGAPQFYERRPSAYWASAQAIFDELAATVQRERSS